MSVECGARTVSRSPQASLCPSWIRIGVGDPGFGERRFPFAQPARRVRLALQGEPTGVIVIDEVSPNDAAAASASSSLMARCASH